MSSPRYPNPGLPRQPIQPPHGDPRYPNPGLGGGGKVKPLPINPRKPLPVKPYERLTADTRGPGSKAINKMYNTY
jgi:hypothetical protein